MGVFHAQYLTGGKIPPCTPRECAPKCLPTTAQEKERKEKKNLSGAAMSKSQNRTRTKSIRTAVTPEEYVEINEKAVAAGLSAGGYLRACSLGRVTPRTKRRPPVDSQILERAIAEMRRIGNNINQIAHASNLNFPLDPEQLRQALKEHLETLQLLREARKR